MSRYVFPMPESFEVTATQSIEGLTKRELFAALALAGLLSNLPEQGNGYLNQAVRQSILVADLLAEKLAAQ